MRRRVILTIVFVLIPVVLLVTLLVMSYDSENVDTSAEVTGVEGDWKIINHPTYGISFRVPIEWNVSVFDSGNGRVSGQFKARDVFAYLDIGSLPKEALGDSELSGVIYPHVGEGFEGYGFNGTRYSGKVLDEGGDPHEHEEDGNEEDHSTELRFIEDSYIVVWAAYKDDLIINARCVITGTNYNPYTSTCDEIIESISPI